MKKEKNITTNVEEPIIPTHEFPEEDDMQAFWNDPTKACEWMQIKYIWTTFEEYSKYWDSLKDYDGEVGEDQELVDETFSNPFTHETKTIKVLRYIQPKDPIDVIAEKIKELRLKLILWTITDEEREMLKLLIW